MGKINSVFLKFGGVFAALALIVGTVSVKQCYFIFHQPEVPESLEKFKK